MTLATNRGATSAAMAATSRATLRQGRAIHRSGSGAQHSTRRVAAVIHVPATVERECDSIGDGCWQLIEDQLGFEIRCHEVACPVGYKYPQARGGRQSGGDGVCRFRR